jgi:hypothetical protein
MLLILLIVTVDEQISFEVFDPPVAVVDVATASQG